MHLSLMSHRKTVGHMDSAEFRGQLLALFMLAAQRFIGKTEGELHLSRNDISWISGKRRADVALKSVQRLLDIMDYLYELRGEVLVTTLPKFAEKQYYATRLRAEEDVVSTPLRDPTNNKEQDTKNNLSEASPSAKVGASDGACEALTTELIESIRSHSPKAHIQSSTWPKTIEQMIRLDNRSPAGMSILIEWLSTENQKREKPFVVMSAKALREKYDRIVIAYKKEQEPINRQRRLENIQEAEHRQRIKEMNAAQRSRKSTPIELSAVIDGIAKGVKSQ
jgi:hypothetical protein